MLSGTAQTISLSLGDAIQIFKRADKDLTVRYRHRGIARLAQLVHGNGLEFHGIRLEDQRRSLAWFVR